MLSAAENAFITSTSRSTPMGELLARYWYPVLYSEELAPGGDPVRVRMFGENYVAFRASDGRVGMLDEACPHRGVSLMMARPGDCALTCIFHGWKFDVEGRAVDVPTEGADRASFGSKVRVRHYATREAAGLLWAYVGPGEPTQFPQFEWLNLPADQVTVLKIPVDCNWLQGVEGLIDSAHVSHLHSDTLNTVYLRDTGGAAETKRLMMADVAPKFDVNTTDYGLQAAAVRTVGDGLKFVRVSEVVLPSWTYIPQPSDEDNLGIVQLPVDDGNTIQWYVMYNMEHAIDKTGIGHGFQSMLEYNGASYLEAVSKATNWGQDRELVKSGHATGFKNIMYEDLAVIRSMGAIVDRTKESLGRTDAGITRYRRQLINAARELEADGTLPPSLSGKIRYGDIHAIQTSYPEDENWVDAVAPLAAALR